MTALAAIVRLIQNADKKLIAHVLGTIDGGVELPDEVTCCNEQGFLAARNPWGIAL